MPRASCRSICRVRRRFVKTNPNDQPVTYIALTSDTLTDGDLYKYATTQVQQRLNILPGVSQVSVYGVKGAIRIKASPGALASRNLTLDDISSGDPVEHGLLRCWAIGWEDAIVCPAT